MYHIILVPPGHHKPVQSLHVPLLPHGPPHLQLLPLWQSHQASNLSLKGHHDRIEDVGGGLEILPHLVSEQGARSR